MLPPDLLQEGAGVPGSAEVLQCVCDNGFYVGWGRIKTTGHLGSWSPLQSQKEEVPLSAVEFRESLTQDVTAHVPGRGISKRLSTPRGPGSHSLHPLPLPSTPFADGEFDAVIIDPPYYDAFQYGDLSDFFYVWLKRSIGHLYPELFATALTPKRAEVIQNRAQRDSAEYISRDEFEARLQRALDEVARVVADDGIVSLVFAHTDNAAWEHLLRALRRAGLKVTTSWPMQSERAGRTTDNVGSVLASSVVLVCRKVGDATDGFYDDVVRDLDARIAERLAVFDDMKLSGADYFVSAIGPAFEVFARYSRVLRLSGDEVGVDELMVLARQAVARHATRSLTGGESLERLDSRALFYLTWRWAYDGLAIPADDAYMLCRAFDLHLDALTVRGGLIRKSGSDYKLLGPHERRSITLGQRPSWVDVMHSACLLYDEGRRQELDALLGASGAGTEPAFWALVTAVTQLLPEGSRERTLLLGLGGNRDDLAERAAKYSPDFEELTLFGTQP
ncbi:hypothetical protein M2271_002087 [Streptomyces sp. LBL]|nr:hypothetical protein [Streptomyces sp. LBL]